MHATGRLASSRRPPDDSLMRLCGRPGGELHGPHRAIRDENPTDYFRIIVRPALPREFPLKVQTRRNDGRRTCRNPQQRSISIATTACKTSPGEGAMRREQESIAMRICNLAATAVKIRPARIDRAAIFNRAQRISTKKLRPTAPAGKVRDLSSRAANRDSTYIGARFIIVPAQCGPASSFLARG